jgi:hypothetical protein
MNNKCFLTRLGKFLLYVKYTYVRAEPGMALLLCSYHALQLHNFVLP